MRAANNDHLHAFAPQGPAAGHEAGDAAGFRLEAAAEQNLSLVLNRLTLANAGEAPDGEWDGAMRQLISWLNLTVVPVTSERSRTLRQRARWPWGSRAAPEAPVFAPWVLHSCLAFQDTRATRELFPARWVSSHLWDPCQPAGGFADVMLISPHPAACRHEEESGVSLPDVRLLQDMIGAANAEGRRRVAVIGHARSRSVIMRQLLSVQAMLRDTPLDLEVLAIEEALARLVDHPGGWDAIIVLPELRGLVFTLLAKLSGIDGAWPMIWHRQGLALLCGETSGPSIAPGRLDAALLVQGLALVAQDAGIGPAARRLSAAWARLRDRGVTTATRGSPSPYASLLSDASFVDLLCSEPETPSRPVAQWNAVAESGPQHERAAALPEAGRLELVRGG